MRTAGQTLNAVLRRFNLRLVRADPRSGGETGFYRPPATCQVPHLGFLYELVFGRASTGCFVEIGAYDGETYSNTSFLADLGWRGVLVEPVPEFAEACRTRHSGNDVVVVEQAVGATPGPVDLFVAGAFTSMNGRQAEEYDNVDWAQDLVRHRTNLTVQATTLDHVLAANSVAAGFEVLVVDTEGGEAQVFEGFDLSHWMPRLMIVELADAHPDLSATRSQDAALGRDIVRAGYDVLYKDSINTVFVRSASSPT